MNETEEAFTQSLIFIMANPSLLQFLEQAGVPYHETKNSTARAMVILAAGAFALGQEDKAFERN